MRNGHVSWGQCVVSQLTPAVTVAGVFWVLTRHLPNPYARKGADMAARKDAQPPVTPDGTQASVAAIEAAAKAKPEPSPWDALKPPVAMPNKQMPSNIKVNVLESVHAAIRERAEASLAVNAKRVAAKATSNAKRARVDYHWDVQPVTDNDMGVALDKALAKYAKYRPSTGDIPFKDEASPMGQVTCRTGVVGYYHLDSDGAPVISTEGTEGAFYGLRYSVRPLEQRGDASRLPGTA